ncbi:MAG: CBS domain-containing protein [Dehalococcoidia bacterium]|nr:CBS domain-containing protein [Dehalococcoidia bacterium]
MSPRAAARLESLGFTKVFDYVEGKADWFAAGLPREGRLASVPRTGDIARRDDVTCRLTDRISDVVNRVREVGKETCIVTTAGNVVLGRVRIDRLEGDTQALAEDVMESGPTTTRADITLESILERLSARDVDTILVGTSDGRLVGTLYRSDVESSLNEGKLEAGQPAEDEVCCCCEP